MSTAIPVVDVDSHISEPPDLWTPRLARNKWGDRIPHVIVDSAGEHRWQIGKHLSSGEANYAVAGWPEYMPSHPPTLEEADPAAWQPDARLQRMDEHGVHAQVLFPNLLCFSVASFMSLGDAELMLSCVQAYNDFSTDFASQDPKRLLPLTCLPFWDVDATVREMQRCAANGHRGVLWASQFDRIGLPGFADEHWTPVYDVAQDLGLAINFHIGFGFIPAEQDAASTRAPVGPEGGRASFVKAAAATMMSNAATISELIVSGLCHRYPNLNFVAIESGVGWIPFLMESLDWQWINNGLHHDYPERDLPSDYFRRQIYASFWYEREGISDVLRLFADNVMFETDFPHPTSLSPGPASEAKNARDTIADNLSDLPQEVLRKILHDNAARVYHVA